MSPIRAFEQTQKKGCHDVTTLFLCLYDMTRGMGALVLRLDKFVPGFFVGGQVEGSWSWEMPANDDRVGIVQTLEEFFTGGTGEILV